MLYENKTAGTFGKTLEDLRKQYPRTSIPRDVAKFGPWTAYTETVKPKVEYGIAEERTPLNGVQNWVAVHRTDRDVVQAEIRKEIDNAAAKAIEKYNPFRTSYYQREEEAKAFIDSEYSGVPGGTLTSLANAIGIEVSQAANLVMRQSVVMRAADEAIENLRMQKYAINYQTDSVPVMIVRKNTIIEAIKVEAAKVQS